MNTHQIARVAHEVNRAYCQALGDNSQPEWIDAPQWQIDSAALGVKLHSEKDVGPEASHESWMAQKVAEGWVYGAAKDPVAKTHPCIVPFAELPPAQQAKDFIFRAVVHALRSTAPAAVQAATETAPRVTSVDLEANIVHTEILKHVTHGGQILRWAIITTQSGFAVTGRPSAAVSAENDDAKIGEKVAFDNAKQELWPLMGYALKQRLHESAMGEAKSAA